MKRLMFMVTMVAAAVMQSGCATSPETVAPQIANNNTNGEPDIVACKPGMMEPCGVAGSKNPESAVALCAANEGCAQRTQPVALGAEIGVEKNAPVVEGHPLTSVVVTQCNLVVAVYMTMPDGKLLRFDRKAEMAAEKLVSIAYTASRSERVEVSCNGVGTAGYETHQTPDSV